MKNSSISQWAHLAIQNFPESHHDSILTIAKYAVGYSAGNRIARSRRPNVAKSTHGEIPYGHYIHGIETGTWKDNDKFFTSLQFMYRHGWISELGSHSLVLSVGLDYKPSPKTNNSRRRDMIGGRKRYAVYTRDNFTCWICGFKTLGIPRNDSSGAWSPSLDHVIPHSRNGNDSYENLSTAHRWCNTVRGDREFSRQIMNARVNCRRSGASAVLEALEHGWEVPDGDLELLRQEELTVIHSVSAGQPDHTAMNQ